ncbi:AraC family transcriptional regulator [Chitinophaga sp. HK235]|uniref:helix-turn-helix domain-containing protein n=1 Tax=Chitinophaga sp. HK235 TaxID=2952571 RepID=UPI001BAD5F78|nr:helix-turn-helix domain-containing protein [Chitinophaga sp. HK235]
MKEIPVRHIAQSTKETGSSGSFLIRDLSPLLSTADRNWPLHRHSFFYMLVLEKGAGEHVIDFTPYPVSDHSVYWIRPGQVHQLALKKGCSGYLIEFSHDFYSSMEKPASQILRKVSSKHFCAVHLDEFNSLYATLTEIFKEYCDKKERYLEVIRANLEILFIKLLRQSRNPKDLSSSNEYMQERLETFRELITQHVTAHKEVAYYAKALHLTTYQLNAITKATLNQTSSEVISSHIVLEAKRLLLATSEQINQIAWQLGYEDFSYFIRFFKKQTGYSPEAFRHKFR